MFEALRDPESYIPPLQNDTKNFHGERHHDELPHSNYLQRRCQTDLSHSSSQCFFPPGPSRATGSREAANLSPASSANPIDVLLAMSKFRYWFHTKEWT